MAGMAIPSGAQDGAIRMAGNAVGLENLKVERSGSNLVVDMDLRLDDLKLPSNIRFVFTPLVKGSVNVRQMSPVVVNGRRQQISYERFARKDFAGNPVVVRRRNGKEQTVHYTGVLPYESWMENANVVLAEDLCGCGDLLDQNTAVLQRLRNYRTRKRGKNGMRKAGLIWISPSTKRPFIRTTATIRRNWRRYSVPSTW